MKTTGALLLTLLLAVTCAFAQYQPHVIWDRSGETDSSVYGYNILPLGDQNGDGYADWAVYAEGNGSGYHLTRASYLEFCLGGSPPSAEPAYVFREDSTLYYRLWYADAIGDVNGDGFQDWMVGFLPLNSQVPYFEGIFYGGHGFSSTPDIQWPIRNGVGLYPLRSVYGEGHGDFNGDGYDDLFEYDFYDNVARIYYGGNPMDTIPDWTLSHPPDGILQTTPYATGDFNGDGASDFLCYNGNPPYNVAIFLGGAHPDTVPAYQWTGVRYWPDGGVQSINGDEPDEFIFYNFDGSDPCVWLGRATLSPTPDFCFDFPCLGGPTEAISAGDFNHDGFNDFILLTDYCQDQWFGTVSVYLGRQWQNLQPAFTIDGETEPLNLHGIGTAAGLGDVNGNGIDDIAIGSYDDLAYLGWRGRCIIIAGDTALVAAAPEVRPEIPRDLNVTVYPNPFNGECTISLNVPMGVGRVRLTTYNLLGQIVAEKEIAAGPGDAICPYDAGDLTSGLYFLRVETGNLQSTTKLMLMK